MTDCFDYCPALTKSGPVRQFGLGWNWFLPTFLSSQLRITGINPSMEPLSLLALLSYSALCPHTEKMISQDTLEGRRPMLRSPACDRGLIFILLCINIGMLSIDGGAKPWPRPKNSCLIGKYALFKFSVDTFSSGKRWLIILKRNISWCHLVKF